MRLWLLGFLLTTACGSAEPAAGPLAVAGSAGVGGTGGSGSVAGSTGTGGTVADIDADVDAAGGTGSLTSHDAGRMDTGNDAPTEPDAEPDAEECDGEIGDSIQELNRETPTRCYHPEGFPGEWCCQHAVGDLLDFPVFTRPLTCGEEGEAYVTGVRTDGPIELADGGLVICNNGGVLLQGLVAVRRCCE